MFIYVLRNKTTGKRYIGYTERDIENYLGSGLYWKKHCNTHGGFKKENIEKEWFEWFEDESDAKEFLSNFEEQYPEYWLDDDWCNLVQENLERSPFAGNMEIIFERHGNPFSGGEIQRRAHAEGRHNYDRSETGRKSWMNRSKEEMKKKIQEGNKKWREENPEAFRDQQRQKAQKAKLALSKRIKYNGELYIGWNDLKERTGISKYKFLKHNLGDLL